MDIHSSTHISEHPNGSTLRIRLLPRSSRNELVVPEERWIKIKVTAPPVDSAANKALIKLLTDIFNIGKGRVRILKGETSRSKTVLIQGLKPNAVLKVLKEHWSS